MSSFTFEYMEKSGRVIVRLPTDNKLTLPEIQDAKAFAAQAHGRGFGYGGRVEFG